MRTRLPNRRPVVTCDVYWNGERIHMSLGLDPMTGKVREIFLCGPKIGSDLQEALNNDAILASFALQGGAELSDLARSMSPSLLSHVLVEASRAAQDTL